ncbi:carboxypeptidase regulatory-like domain-containing protein [candidate division KSB1 bacterium]|nr:carboxypeptidase regulatory-like domain-containing protein [candidate division KSB1 bacterium]
MTISSKARSCTMITLIISVIALLLGNPIFASTNFLQSQENLQAELVLTAIPLGLIPIETVMIIQWNPATSGEFHYSLVPGGGIPTNYPMSVSASKMLVNNAGEMQFMSDNLATGVYYCIITSGADHSAEFVVIREPNTSPRMTSPRTANGEPGIDTNTPNFQWESVTGVPFYHLVLSDQPFTVEKDEFGNLQATGANVIWQAITSETSIQYGTPDPSGFFTYTEPPPLVKGVIYNWVVVNNFANNPAASSSVTSGPVRFSVDVSPPFEAPENVAPAQGAFEDGNITFIWSEVEGASLYHIYLSRFEEVKGSDALVSLWDGVTSNNLFDLSAGVLQQEGKYYWKVLAQDESGNGAMGDTTSFYYSTRSALVHFYSKDIQGTNLPRSMLTLESLTHGTNPMSIPTDDTGWLERSLPLGTYRVTGAKDGFQDTTIVFSLTVENELKTVIVPLTPSPSSVYGSTKNSGGSPLGFVVVNAVSQSSGLIKEVTSDLNGNFSIGLPPDTWILSASKSGYKSSSARTLYLGPSIDLNLDLSGNGGPFVLTKNMYTLNGTIATPEGEPIMSSTVTATSGDEQEVTITDDKGQYLLSLGVGGWSIEATKAGYVSPQPQSANIIDHNVTLDITLTPKANIVSGTVFSMDVPLANATVNAIPNSGSTILATTNAYGQFTLSLGRGTFQIVPSKTGYISPDPQQFSLTVGQTISGISFDMEPQNCYITGEITSDGSTQLSGVTVTNGSQVAVTGTNGRYTLGVLAGTYTVSASKQGYLAGENRVVTLTPGQTLSGIDFVLTPNASVLTGTITNGSLAVSNATVTATNQTHGTVVTAKTNTNGVFSLSVTAGTYSLSAAKSGFVSSPTSRSVTVAPGQTVPNLNFSFVEYISYISGVVKQNTTPLRNANVLVTGIENPNQTYSTVTGVDGTFNLSVRPELSYQVKVTKTSYYSKTSTTSKLSVGTTTSLTFQLTPQQSLITGYVKKSDGSALANAVVQAGTFSATANSGGFYSLGIDAGTYTLSAQKSGYLPGSKSITVSVGDTLAATNFTLTPNYASVDGTVTGSITGVAISGALVVVTESGTGQGGSAYTNDQGHYLIQNLPAGVYTITITHVNYQKATIENKAFAGGSTNRVNSTMAPKNSMIAGRVLSNGSGIGGVTITASASGVTKSTVTGQQGYYTIANLTPATFTVGASLTGYTSSPASQTAVVTANDTVTVNFSVVANQGSITGTVTQGGIGKGGVQVVASGASGNSGFIATATDGKYTISNLAMDTYTVAVNIDGYSSSPASASVVMGAGQTHTANFALTRNVVQITGTVKNQAGSAIANVKVVGQSASGSVEATTNASGQYTLNNIALNAQYLVKTDLYEEGYLNSETSVNVGSSNVSNINLQVDIATARIRGNIGIANANVSAYNSTRDLTYSTLSQPDGSFRLRGLYDGNYTVRVNMLGYKGSPSEQTVSSLVIGEIREGVNFTMTEIKITVAGKVTNSSGTALANVPVLAWSSSATGRDTTDASGNYSIANLPPSVEYTIQTKLPVIDYDNNSKTITAGESDVTVPAIAVTVHNSTIQGTLTNDTGAAVAGAIVSLTGVDSVVYSDAAGAYIFPHLYPGNYTITVSKEGYQTPSPVDVSLSENQTLTRDISGLAPLRSAIYGVVSAAQTRLVNAIVRIFDESTNTLIKSDTTDAGGIYSVQDLNINSSFRMTVNRTGYQAGASSGISLASGSMVRDFTLTPIPNSIFGKVVNKSANINVSQAAVRLNGLDGGTWADTTDSFGYFSIGELLSGSYAIVSEEGDLMSPSQTITLAAGEAQKVTLLLEKPAIVEGHVTYQSEGRSGAKIRATNTLAGTIASATSDADGYFKITGLLTGDYTVTCAIQGFSASPASWPVAIQSGETKSVDFTLTGENNAIMGSITDANSNALSGVKVVIWNSSFRDSVFSDLDGQYQLTDLVDGTYSVKPSLAGYYDIAATTTTLSGGQPALVDFQMTPLSNAISGFVKDGLSGNVIANAIVTATDANSTVYTDTSATDGSFLFELTAGTYLLQATKAGYESGTASEVELVAGSSASKNLILTPIFSTAAITGVVSKGEEGIADATVSCTSLTDASFTQTTMTDATGAYSLTNLPTPGEYIVQVSKDGYVTLGSPVLELTEAGLVYDFGYPSGQFKWVVTRDGFIPVPNVKIRINLGSAERTLFTNNNGESETKDNLDAGDYRIIVEADAKNVPLSNFNRYLAKDTVLVEALYLPFIHTPVTSVPALQSLKLTVQTLAVPEDTLWLYTKQVGKSVFTRQEMTTDGSAGDTLLYSATIPAQGVSGEISYYLQTNYQNHVYSQANNPNVINVTREGLLTKLNIENNTKQIPTGVPTLLQVRPYDGVDKPVVPDQVSWQIISGPGALSDYSADSTKVWFKSIEDSTTHVQITVVQDNVTLVASMTIVSETRVLGSLKFPSLGAVELSNRESKVFTYSATDTSGRNMSVWPIWRYKPKNSGMLVVSDDWNSATFTPDSNFVGQVNISVKDSLTGTVAEFNSDGIADGDKGLKIFQVITATSQETHVTDSEGFVLTIPSGAVDAGVSMKVKLSKPQIPDVKRYTGKYKVSGSIFDLNTSAQIKDGKSFTLQLPIPEAVRQKSVTVGHWDVNELDWKPMQSTRVDTTVVAATTHFSQFAVLQTSDPLNIKDITLLPNPFTPNDPYGLQIGFNLSSNDVAKPFVTIKIYNMAGDLVRTLVDNEPMAPELYEAGGESTLKWDGTTDSGAVARNGRYLVVLEAKDNTGDKREMKTVVLIK